MQYLKITKREGSFFYLYFYVILCNADGARWMMPRDDRMTRDDRNWCCMTNSFSGQHGNQLNK